MKTILNYLVNDARKTLLWMSAHPIKSASFFYLFGLLPAVAGACECLRTPAIALFAASLIAFSLAMWLDTRKIALLLCAVLFFQGANLNAEEPQRPPEPSVLPVVVVVLVIGGVFFFGLRRLCQRTMPKPPSRDTNAQPFMALSPASASDNYGATWVFVGWLSDECLMPSGGENEAGIPTMMMELRGTVQRTPNGIEWRLSQARLDHTQDLVDAAEYERLLLVEHGVPTGRSAGEQHYAVNGVPCTAWESPIQFSTEDDGRPNVTVANGGELFDCAMERSEDLVNWQEIGRMRVSDGQQVRVTDTTISSQMFYRFRSR